MAIGNDIIVESRSLAAQVLKDTCVVEVPVDRGSAPGSGGNSRGGPSAAKPLGSQAAGGFKDSITVQCLLQGTSRPRAYRGEELIEEVIVAKDEAIVYLPWDAESLIDDECVLRITEGDVGKTSRWEILQVMPDSQQLFFMVNTQRITN